eukprot:m.54422 g.54422  ORF g.54422 m.54422 type:complete len:496 (+) comp11085_c0_seq6:29-1516(+)
MSFTCAISGTVPQHPVISPKSGAVFERELIEKHLRDNDTDPINGEQLTVDELIDVKGGDVVQPRAPNATSIPALLRMLQDEWDAEVLASFELKKYVTSLRQELTHSLYQNDAACRLIARLTKERDQAREALSTMGPSSDVTMDTTPEGAEQQQQEEEGAIPSALLETIAAVAKKLSKQRKKKFKALKKSPDTFPSTDIINNYSLQKTHSGLHSSRSQNILSLGITPQIADIFLSGASDKTAKLFDRSKEEVLSTFKHKKKVTGAILHPAQDLAITCSLDKTVQIWTTAGDNRHTINHEGGVTGMSLHPSNDYLLSFDDVGNWTMSDLYTGGVITTQKDDAASDGVTCGAFHVDGKLFALGTNGNGVRVWSVADCACVQTFEHTGKITALAFSENGFFLATASDALVNIWDLRKPAEPLVKSIELDAGKQVNALAFDNTGRFLAVGGDDLRVYETEEWELKKTFSDHSRPINALQWSDDTTTLFSAGGDNSICVYA